jgi:hypothetical protein
MSSEGVVESKNASVTSEPVQVITVPEEAAEDCTSLGTDAFLKELLKLLNSDKLWRSVQFLAESLHVDVRELDKWLGDRADFVRKPSQKDGKYYYAYAPRFSRETGGGQKKEMKVGSERVVVKEEHRYALAQIYLIYDNLHKVLKTYAMDVHEIDSEAFNHFNLALNKLESGLALFARKTGASDEKLPRLSK